MPSCPKRCQRAPSRCCAASPIWRRWPYTLPRAAAKACPVCILKRKVRRPQLNPPRPRTAGAALSWQSIGGEASHAAGGRSSLTQDLGEVLAAAWRRAASRCAAEANQVLLVGARLRAPAAGSFLARCRVAPKGAPRRLDQLQNRDALVRRALAGLQQQANVVEESRLFRIDGVIERQIVEARLRHVDGIDALDNNRSVKRHVAGARYAARNTARCLHGAVVGRGIKR